MAGRHQKHVLEKVLTGRSDANIAFPDLVSLLRQLGFSERMKGGHYIWKRDVVEILNLQPIGSKVKPYQVRQVRKILLKYRLVKYDLGPTMTSRYEIIIFWSDTDDCFVAEVPELPGCMADGRTYQEALANAEVIMQEWIDTAIELGRSIPEPRGRLRYA